MRIAVPGRRQGRNRKKRDFFFRASPCHRQVRTFFLSLDRIDDYTEDVNPMRTRGTCVFCSAKAGDSWCDGCLQDLLPVIHRCPICAKANDSGHVCGQCLKKRPGFFRVLALFEYQFPVDRLIKSFKFNKQPALSVVFAKHFVNRLDKTDATPKLLLPVPLFKGRQRSRGYNQSLEFAKHLGKETGIAVDSTSCIRIKNCVPQSSLPRNQRKTNVAGAFALKTNTLPDHVAIVDDVMTTGATVSEITRLLKTAGCRTVEVWTVARA